MNQIIGIGEYIVSNQEEDTLITYALASCVAVTIYCPNKKAAGMIHIALPNPMDMNISSKKLGYYATTGLPILFETMYNKFGCIKETLNIQLFGGANSIRMDDVFSVGPKNIEAVESILSAYKLKYDSKEVGGFISRSIEMKIATGAVKLNTQPIQI